MIVKSLSLHNFGLYAGDHMIDLSKTSSERPVILIGGLNGRGKTTILEALLLGLYGKQSFAFTTSKLSYGDYLKRYISTGVDCHDSSIEIKLQVRRDQPILTIRRSWSDAENPIVDHFSVYTQDGYDYDFSENWPSFMETVLPAGISKLFFFDGEKITELANDQTDEGLKSAIKSLLGIDTIDRLLYDLNRIVSRQELVEHHGEKDAVLREQMDLLSESIQNQQLDEAQIEVIIERLNELTNEENKLQQKITSRGGGVVQDRKRFEKDLDDVKEKLEDLNSKILGKVAGVLPIAMVMPLVRDLQKRAQSEQIHKQKQVAWEQMRTLEKDLDQLIKKEGGSEELIKSIHDLFSSYAGEAFSASLGIEISGRVVDQMRRLCGGEIAEELEKTKELLKKRQKLEERRETLKQYIRRAKNEIEVNEIYADLRVCLGEQEKYKQMLRDLESSLQQEKASIREYEKSIRQLKQQMIDEEQDRLKESRIVRYTNTAIHVLETFKIRLQQAKVVNLSTLITERFLMLSEKKNLVDSVKVDPESLALTLNGVDGKQFSISKLSAGERQMLVIALLWGLAASLENPLPIVIDTPLARLDSQHRKNFVQKYLPNASQQVIVLSTDEEINGDYAEILAPYTAAKYLLKYNAEQNRTSIQEGYFKR